jgi:hypothetical protein
MMRQRFSRVRLAVLALIGAILLASSAFAGDRKSSDPAPNPTAKPAASGQTTDAKQIDVKLDLRPDLVVELSASPTFIYPVFVKVKNEGNSKIGASKLKVTCDEYKGALKVGPCLSKIEEDIPALEPGKGFSPTLPFAPGLHCDPEKSGITLCRVTATLITRRGVTEKSTTNNKKTLEVLPLK